MLKKKIIIMKKYKMDPLIIEKYENSIDMFLESDKGESEDDTEDSEESIASL